jgi:excisionase family DNA binding protein
MNTHTETSSTTTSTATAPLSATPVPTPAAASPSPQAPVELLTQRQLAQRLGVSLRTVASWAHNRVVPMIKIRGFCRFDFAKVQAVLLRHERPEAGSAESFSVSSSSPESDA